MAFKIDLEKAYDKISWGFRRDTLHFFNFNASWIDLIMSCVTNFSTAILWNGEPLNKLSPQRGLIQGDPLSPYLFVLCMERLSILINAKVEEGQWKGIRVARNSDPITHLFFADDLILFGEDKINTCRAIMAVMDDFCFMSGQTINFSRSKLFVSKNVHRRHARNLSSFSGIPLTTNLGKYLGIPLLHGRAKREHYDHILENMEKKMSTWKSTTLAMAGRVTLVQSSSSTMPSYTMQTMALPSSVCDRIDKINRNFLW